MALMVNCVPDKCKLSVGKVRAELKLKKANLIHWSEYEVSGTSGTLHIVQCKSLSCITVLPENIEEENFCGLLT